MNAAAPTHAPILRVGCAMWAHRPWIGTFLPATTRSDAMLAAYAARLGAVEGNTTFYALPSAATVARWAEQAPSSFRFAFKLPRVITHESRLRQAGDALKEFLDRLAPLADRMGPTSVQLPASFAPADLAALESFLDQLPAEFEWAVEVRHRDFFAGGPAERPLDELLARRGVNRVILDTRSLRAGPCDTPAERDEWRSKPDLPVRPVATAAHPVVRFIGQTTDGANDTYWGPWLVACQRWLGQGLEPYVFFHTPDNVASPALAHRFAAEMTARVPDLVCHALPPAGAGDLSNGRGAEQTLFGAS